MQQQSQKSKRHVRDGETREPLAAGDHKKMTAERKPLKRPPAIYTNKTPYGIASRLLNPTKRYY